MKKVRWLIDAALVGALGLLAPTAAQGSVDAGVPDAGAEDGEVVPLYGAYGCVASGGEALPGTALAAGLALRRRRSKQR